MTGFARSLTHRGEPSSLKVPAVMSHKQAGLCKILGYLGSQSQLMLFGPVRSITGYNRLTGQFPPKTRPQDYGRLRNRRQLWTKVCPIQSNL